MSERAKKYRDARRKEVLAAVRECQELLETVEKAFAPEWAKAQAALVRAGERFDKTRREDDPIEWSELWWNAIEPAALQGELELVFSSAKEELDDIRTAFEK